MKFIFRINDPDTGLEVNDINRAYDLLSGHNVVIHEPIHPVFMTPNVKMYDYKRTVFKYPLLVVFYYGKYHDEMLHSEVIYDFKRPFEFNTLMKYIKRKLEVLKNY